MRQIAVTVSDLVRAIEYYRDTRGVSFLFQAWISDSVREALAFLRRSGVDWRNEGAFIDAQGIVRGNPQ